MEVYLILGIAIVIAVIVLAYWLNEKKRTDAMGELASSLKFSFSKKEDFSFLADATLDEGQGASFDEHIEAEIEAALEMPEGSDLYRSLLERVERPLLEAVLARTEGNQIRAATILGINRNTLRKKINDLDIHLPSRNRP
jgi:DNA-binding protein Fis